MAGAEDGAKQGAANLMAAWLRERAEEDFPAIAAKIIEEYVQFTGKGPDVWKTQTREMMEREMCRFVFEYAGGLHVDAHKMGDQMAEDTRESFFAEIFPLIMEQAAEAWCGQYSVMSRNPDGSAAEELSGPAVEAELRAWRHVMTTMGVRTYGWLLGKIREGRPVFNPDGMESGEVH